MASSTITLLCLAVNHEGNALGAVFPLHISPRALVSDLQKAIKSKKANDAEGVDADRLVLWKLLTPPLTGCTSIEQTAFRARIQGLEFPSPESDEARKGNGVAQLLYPSVKLSRYWMDDPDEDHLHLIVQVPRVERPKKRQKLASEDGTATLAMSDMVATSQTAAHGAGWRNPPPKITLDNAIQQAKAFLERNSHSLKLAATTDPQLGDSDPFFVDGLGALYDAEPSTKDRVVELFEPGISRVVFNTSGSGKTRLLVEGLCQYWGFYLTPDRHPRLGSTDFSLSLSDLNFYVENGNFSRPTIPDSPNSGPKSLELNRAFAQIVFHHILLARLLVLEAFLSAGADIPSPHLRYRWTHLQLVPSALKHQFSGDVQDIFERVYQIIAQCRARGESQVLSLLATIRQDSRVPSDSPLFVILDEAQLCSHLYEEAFYPEEEPGLEGIRSVLREISVAWECFGQSSFATIYSGIGFSLTRILRSRANQMAIYQDSRVFTNTGAFVSQEQQSAYIMRHVTLEEDTKEEVLRRAWRWLRGRHRFTAGFVYVLRRCGAKNASALLTFYVYVLTGYRPTDDPRNTTMTHHELEVVPKFKNMSEDLKKLDDRLRHRVAFAINTFTLRHKPYLLDSSEAETIEFGIARYTTSSEGFFKSIVINEPLIIAGALKHFEISAVSIEDTLRQSICYLPMATGSVRGHDLEAIGMFVLAQQLDGTRSLREIFNFQTPSVDIGEGKAQLIAIDEMNQDGTFRYSIVKDTLRYPFGVGYEAGNPSEHEQWFEGTGVPFCFPDPRSGHDVGFFVLVDGDSVVFVMNQFKSYSKDLGTVTMRRALKTLSPTECYKDKNGKIYTPGKLARRKILSVLKHSKIPCLGVFTSFPSNPHFPTIDEKAPEHFALFDISRVDADMGRILAGFKSNQFPHFGDPALPEWPVEDE